MLITFLPSASLKALSTITYIWADAHKQRETPHPTQEHFHMHVCETCEKSPLSVREEKQLTHIKYMQTHI